MAGLVRRRQAPAENRVPSGRILETAAGASFVASEVLDPVQDDAGVGGLGLGVEGLDDQGVPRLGNAEPEPIDRLLNVGGCPFHPGRF